MGFSVEIIGLLFFVALVAGFIDAIAGGGGLITIPALLMTGMPPISCRHVAVLFPPVCILSANAP